MKDKIKSSLEKRSLICFFVITLLFLSCALKLADISTKDYETVRVEQSTRRITVSKPRGTIYDTNMIPITNSSTKLIAIISPTPRTSMVISEILEGKELESVLNELSQGKPAICEIPYDPECDGIVVKKIYNHYDKNAPAVHTIGYLDDRGHGVCGLEAAYDDLLFSDETIDAVYSTNGMGKTLSGIDSYFEGDEEIIGNGVISTIDINLQEIVQKESETLKKGAVVVCETKNGKIRAIVSRPDFNIKNISESLKDIDSPLLNRALNSFSVGSVFKPCTAAAAIESDNEGFSCTCIGAVRIGNRSFKCHKQHGHGLVDMNNAIAQSCNSFFYNIAIKTGSKNIYTMASKLNFGNKIKVADNFYTSSGNLPTKDTLNTDAALANIGIGQGELLLSPVSMLTLYCAIAENGRYYLPSLVEGTIINGKKTPYDIGSPTTAMNKKTAEMLRNYLTSVITNGTGKDATPKKTTAAGKTATAQTGQYENNTEITNSWFCGFFPAESPKYAVIVMSQGTPEKSTASIFSSIADSITELQKTEISLQ